MSEKYTYLDREKRKRLTYQRFFSSSVSIAVKKSNNSVIETVVNCGGCRWRESVA
jgi:hypothetical protein